MHGGYQQRDLYIMHQVLIIDDESSVRTLVRLLLERLDCRVEEAEDGKAGLQKAQQVRPDLILCDLDMPVLDGFETLLQVRQDSLLREVPVIVVSGVISDDIERRVMRLGANAVLRKPFSFATLTNLVKGLLPVAAKVDGRRPPLD